MEQNKFDIKIKKFMKLVVLKL